MQSLTRFSACTIHYLLHFCQGGILGSGPQVSGKRYSRQVEVIYSFLTAKKSYHLVFPPLESIILWISFFTLDREITSLFIFQQTQSFLDHILSGSI